MDKIIIGIFKVQSDFALEVWFSIFRFAMRMFFRIFVREQNIVT